MPLHLWWSFCQIIQSQGRDGSWEKDEEELDQLRRDSIYCSPGYHCHLDQSKLSTCCQRYFEQRPLKFIRTNWTDRKSRCCWKSLDFVFTPIIAGTGGCLKSVSAKLVSSMSLMWVSCNKPGMIGQDPSPAKNILYIFYKYISRFLR